MKPKVGIIGAGISGLACARTLKSAGIPSIIFEASSEIGGRVKTEVKDGFLLDNGFQIFPSAYSITRSLTDKLTLFNFTPGALIFSGSKKNPFY